LKGRLQQRYRPLQLFGLVALDQRDRLSEPSTPRLPSRPEDLRHGADEQDQDRDGQEQEQPAGAATGGPSSGGADDQRARRGKSPGHGRAFWKRVRVRQQPAELVHPTGHRVRRHAGQPQDDHRLDRGRAVIVDHHHRGPVTNPSDPPAAQHRRKRDRPGTAEMGCSVSAAAADIEHDGGTAGQQPLGYGQWGEQEPSGAGSGRAVRGRPVADRPLPCRLGGHRAGDEHHCDHQPR